MTAIAIITLLLGPLTGPTLLEASAAALDRAVRLHRSTAARRLLRPDAETLQLAVDRVEPSPVAPPLRLELVRMQPPLHFHTDRSDVGGAALALMATYAPRLVKVINGPCLLIPMLSTDTAGGLLWGHF